jgi:hypothetical protein
MRWVHFGIEREVGQSDAPKPDLHQAGPREQNLATPDWLLCLAGLLSRA